MYGRELVARDGVDGLVDVMITVCEHNVQREEHDKDEKHQAQSPSPAKKNHACCAGVSKEAGRQEASNVDLVRACCAMIGIPPSLKPYSSILCDG